MVLERVVIDLGECGDLVWVTGHLQLVAALLWVSPPPHARDERRDVFKSPHDLPKVFLPSWKHGLCLLISWWYLPRGLYFQCAKL